MRCGSAAGAGRKDPHFPQGGRAALSEVGGRLALGGDLREQRFQRAGAGRLAAGHRAPQTAFAQLPELAKVLDAA